MAQNDFLVWAGGSNANVLTQANYSALSNLTSGVVSGKASGQQANKTWRQSSIMSAMIAKFIVDRVGTDVIDDGSIQTIENNFIAAISSLFVIPNTGVVPGAYGPTIAISVQADGRITSLQNANLQGTGLTPGTYVAPTITVGTDGRITGIVSVAYGPLAGTNTWTATNTFIAGVKATGTDNGGSGLQFRAISGNYGAGIRNDGGNVYLLQTAAGQQNGVWNSFRPFSWSLATGAVAIDGQRAGTTFGPVTAAPGASITTADNAVMNTVMVGRLGDLNYGIDTQKGAYWSFDQNDNTPARGGWFSPVQVTANNVLALTGNTYQNMYAANFVVQSDAVSKSNIQDVSSEDALEFVNSIKAKKYVRNGNTETGFVAQDVHAHGSFEHMVRRMGQNDDETSKQLGLNVVDPIAYHHAALKFLLEELGSTPGSSELEVTESHSGLSGKFSVRLTRALGERARDIVAGFGLPGGADTWPVKDAQGRRHDLTPEQVCELYLLLRDHGTATSQ